MSLKKRQAAFYPKTNRPLSKRPFCFDPILPAEVHGYRTHPGEIIKKIRQNASGKKHPVSFSGAYFIRSGFRVAPLNLLLSSEINSLYLKVSSAIVIDG
jgi:hypothetical protein